MSRVDPFDRHLDPPDDPIYSDCEGCKKTFRTDGELTKVKISRWYHLWLCESCVEKREKDEE